MLKRIFDVIFSFVGIFVLIPLFILIAIWIKMDSKGPIFYRGERVGRGGGIFHIYKFRSMIVEAEKTGGTTTSHSDPRITKVGKIIRKYKLDELSQLFNVFLGDMSLVGPRPQVKWAVELYNSEERKILQLRPGITDWASIRFNNEEDIVSKSGIADADEAYMKLIYPEKMQLQIKYLYERSFWTDIKIIFLTLSTVLKTRFAKIENELSIEPDNPKKDVGL